MQPRESIRRLCNFSNIIYAVNLIKEITRGTAARGARNLLNFWRKEKITGA